MENKTNGVSVSVVLAIIFTVLKLCGVITWSWWWVLSPLWIGLLLFVVVTVGLFIFWYVRG